MPNPRGLHTGSIPIPWARPRLAGRGRRPDEHAQHLAGGGGGGNGGWRRRADQRGPAVHGGDEDAVAVFPGEGRRGQPGRLPARGHRRRREGVRRHHRRDGAPALPQRRHGSHRSRLRLPRLHPRRGARHADDDRRPRDQGRGAGARAGPADLRGRQGRGKAGVAPRAAAAQRLPDERRQHPARRAHRRGAALRGAAGAGGRRLRARVSRGGRAALLEPPGGDGRARPPLRREPLPAQGPGEPHAVLPGRLRGSRTARAGRGQPLARRAGSLRRSGPRHREGRSPGDRPRQPRLHPPLPPPGREDPDGPAARPRVAGEVLRADGAAPAARDAGPGAAPRIRLHRRRVGLDERLSPRHHQAPHAWAPAQPARRRTASTSSSSPAGRGSSPRPRCRHRPRTCAWPWT